MTQGMMNFRKTILLSIVVAGLVVLGLALPARAMSVTTCPGDADVDTDPATTVDCLVTTPGAIVDVDVELVVFNTDDDGDDVNSYIDNLVITLSFNGISVVLYDGDGDNDDAVMEALFDDAAADPPPTSGSVFGTFRPSGPGSLADFNGQLAAGTWTLEILDDSVPNDGTDLVAFNLIITTVEIAEPATLALLGLGLAGLGLARRRRAA